MSDGQTSAVSSAIRAHHGPGLGSAGGVANAPEIWKPAPDWEWDRNTTHKSGFLHPIGAFTRFIPRAVNHALAVGLGTLLGHAMTKTRQVLTHNLERIGRGRFSRERVRRMILQTFHNYARYLVDFMEITTVGPERAGAMVRRFSGKKTYEAVLGQGRGLILVTPHLGNWELGGFFLAQQGFPLNVMSLVAPDTATVAMRENIRERVGIRHLYVGGTQSPLGMIDVVNALRRNEIVAMLCDRDTTGFHATVDLFGHPVRLPMGPAMLAQVSGAPLVPSFVVLVSGKYECFIGKPIHVEPARGDRREFVLEARTQDLAREFEKVIERFPTQWYNFYPSWLD